MEFEFIEDLGPESDFWHLITEGYINPYEICKDANEASQIAQAIDLLLEFKRELRNAGILNEC